MYLSAIHVYFPYCFTLYISECFFRNKTFHTLFMYYCHQWISEYNYIYQGRMNRGSCAHLPLFKCVGEGGAKNSPRQTHTHFWNDWKKQKHGVEILVWKQKMCSESMFCLSVLKILTPHFQVASWSSPFLSTSKACLHFLAHSYTSVYERLNFKIASQKVAHTCVHYFVFTDLVFLTEKQQSVLFVALLFHVFCTMWLCRKISIFILEWFFFVCTFDEYIIKLQVRQKKTYQFW